MTLALALLGRLAWSQASANRCIGNHTVRSSSGECECEPGFPFGDPDSEIGCFRCVKPCSDGSICVKMDVCACKPGYQQVGPRCVPHFPLPSNVSPSGGVFSGGYPVLVRLSAPSNVSQVFCRFGDVIVAGRMRNNLTIQCNAPAGRPGACELRVSSDANNWNLPGIPFEYKYDATRAIMNWVLEVASIATVIGIVSIAFRAAPPTEEMQPLIQSIPNATDDHTDLSMQGFYPL